MSNRQTKRKCCDVPSVGLSTNTKKQKKTASCTLTHGTKRKHDATEANDGCVSKVAKVPRHVTTPKTMSSKKTVKRKRAILVLNKCPSSLSVDATTNNTLHDPEEEKTTLLAPNAQQDTPSLTLTGQERKRKPKRRLVPKPTPRAGFNAVYEPLSVVKCTMKRMVKHKKFYQLIQQVVLEVNQRRKRVSMLAKELLLTKLESAETIPVPNQSFYAALHTSLMCGKWKHGHDEILMKRMMPSHSLDKRLSLLVDALFEKKRCCGEKLPRVTKKFKSDLAKSLVSGRWEHGHDEILMKYKVKRPKLRGTLMTQAMSLAARKLAAELDCHYRKHYDRFYKRWKKAKDIDKEDNANEHFVDPEDAELVELIKHSWMMRRDMEDAEAKAFALFPESKIAMSYVTLDSVCITQIYKILHPTMCIAHNPDTRKDVPITTGDLSMLHRKRIFRTLFHMKTVHALKHRRFHFTYSMNTDGYGVAFNFSHEVHYNKKTDKSKQTSAVPRDMTTLHAGFASQGKNVSLSSLNALGGTTIRCVDPGVIRTYVSVDLRSDEADVRDTEMHMTSRAWHNRIGSARFRDLKTKLHEEALGVVQLELDSVPHRKSSYSSLYGTYVDQITKHWGKLWAFHSQRKHRKVRFRQWCIRQRELDREVDRLSKPRDGDTKTILLYGNAACTNSFGRIKGNVKGPAKQLAKRIQERKTAVLIWADEFRSSMLGLDGNKVIHPPERRKDRLRVKKCEAKPRLDSTVHAHAPGTQGCVCLCVAGKCKTKRTVGRFCDKHKKLVTRYNVCYHDNDSFTHRLWNRDLLAAINIGLRLLSSALGLPLGNWDRNVKKDDMKHSVGWAVLGMGTFPSPKPLYGIQKREKKKDRAHAAATDK